MHTLLLSKIYVLVFCYIMANVENNMLLMHIMALTVKMKINFREFL